MIDRPDYKKTYFEKQLNRKPQTNSISGIIKRLRQYGYHCEYYNGYYYVYTQYEWDVRSKYEDKVKSFLDQLLGE